jgi:hypothetical protein
MRPLGENAYWLVLPAIFGADALPLHIAAFLTQCASLLLLGSVVRRLTKSGIAAFSAQILWMANIGLAPALGWSSIYNQILSGFFFLLAFYFLLRYVESESDRTGPSSGSLSSSVWERWKSTWRTPRWRCCMRCFSPAL